MFVLITSLGCVGEDRARTAADDAEPASSTAATEPSLHLDPSLLQVPQELPGEWSPVVGNEIRPFWRKGDRPTYAPPWYANRGDVTQQIAQASGESDEAAGERLFEALQNLQPGDHLLIREGTYSVDRWLRIRAAGTEEQPIVIRGAPGETITITRPDAEKNVIDIDQSRYLVIESLRIRGGSNAIKFYAADHVMLYDLDVSDSADAAITANADETSYLSIVDCEISHTGGHGEGLYLGGHNGKNITHHAAVVGNYIHHLAGPSVEQGDGIEIKQGSYGCQVRYNFVQNTNYPGITVYGSGRGLEDRNVIEANIVIDTNDYAVQICADAVVRNNLIVNSRPQARAFVSKPGEVASPGHLLIVNNTVLAMDRGVVRQGWDAPGAVGIVLANNAIYSHYAEAQHGDPGDAVVHHNVYIKSLDTFVDVDFETDRLDATPRAGSVLIGAGDPALAPKTDLLGHEREPNASVAGAIIRHADR